MLEKVQKKQVFYPHNKIDQNEKLPVTRSSSTFYFSSTPNCKTSIHVLNYWTIKRGISDITMKLTLRSMSGETVCVEDLEVPEIGAIDIQLEEVINKNGLTNTVSEGSVELEIFSETNMFIPFPGVVVRYRGENWHTSTHTSQRYFSLSSADENVDDLSFGEEGNQTIHKDPNLEPFIIVHNGHTSFTDGDAYVEVTSRRGKKVQKKLPPVEWKPYETRIMYLKDILDFREVLDGDFGTYRFGYTSRGVFPRLIAGFENVKSKGWSIDHTNFAASSGPVLEDQFVVNNSKGFKNLVFKIPNLPDGNFGCFADIYPTYPDGEFSVTLNKNDGNAVFAETVSLPARSQCEMTRIDLSECKDTEFIFSSEEKLPRRFHVGIHYTYKDSDPSFLIDGPIPHQSKGQSTRWAPLFSSRECDNYLFISNRATGNDQSTALRYSGRIYNSFGDEPLVFEFDMPSEGELALNLDREVEGLSEFLGDLSGWIYLNSDVPAKCVMHYLSVYKDQSIACDHAF